MLGGKISISDGIENLPDQPKPSTLCIMRLLFGKCQATWLGNGRKESRYPSMQYYFERSRWALHPGVYLGLKLHEWEPPSGPEYLQHTLNPKTLNPMNPL